MSKVAPHKTPKEIEVCNTTSRCNVRRSETWSQHTRFSGVGDHRALICGVTNRDQWPLHGLTSWGRWPSASPERHCCKGSCCCMRVRQGKGLWYMCSKADSSCAATRQACVLLSPKCCCRQGQHDCSTRQTMLFTSHILICAHLSNSTKHTRISRSRSHLRIGP